MVPSLAGLAATPNLVRMHSPRPARVSLFAYQRTGGSSLRASSRSTTSKSTVCLRPFASVYVNMSFPLCTLLGAVRPRVFFDGLTLSVLSTNTPEK